jgi:hypothetical protein
MQVGSVTLYIRAPTAGIEQSTIARVLRNGSQRSGNNAYHEEKAGLVFNPEPLSRSSIHDVVKYSNGLLLQGKVCWDACSVSESGILS